MRLTMLFFILLCLLFGVRGQDNDRNILFAAGDYDFPYDLVHADAKIELPTKLREISGLSLIDQERFAAVQDEKGNIYIINFRSGEIEHKIDFASDGDYEGITLVGEDAWVLKSNGDLYRVKYFLDEIKMNVTKYETDLSKKNDLEGVAYDKENNRLLIAAKGHPYIDNEGGKHKKAIYQFDLEEKKLKSRPLYIIDLEEIKYYKKYNTMTRLGIDLLATLDKSKGDVTFQPSDVAIHPFSGNIYVIGAVGDLLIVLHPQGEMLAMVDLDDTLFNQPEGIFFGPRAELYISNEAGERKATILKFERKK